MGWFEDTLDVGANLMTAGMYGLVKDGKLGGNVLMGTDSKGNPIYSTDKAAAARQADLESGFSKGQELFYDNPDMKAIRAKREDLAKGYSGEELGAMRATARGEIAGQRQNYLRNMQSNLARGGVGGARAAAVRGAADQKFAGTAADAERKMALDSANMVRKGTDDLQDLYMRQLLGKVGMGTAYGQMGVADRTAAESRAANSSQEKKGLFGLGIGPF